MVGIPQVRAFSRLAARSIRREQDRRRLRRADSTLLAAATADHPIPVTVPAPPLMRTRTLPARAVLLRSPAEHRRSLAERLAQELSAAGIPHTSYPALGDHGRTVLVVAAQDWDGMLRAVATSTPSLLLAGSASPRAASGLPVHLGPPADGSGWSVMHVLDPAVTTQDGRVQARYGFDTAVTIERWSPTEDEPATLRPPRYHPRTDRLPAQALAAAPPEESDRETLEALSTPTLFEVTFPIDVVYTWVDGTDPAWIERKRTAIEQETGEGMTEAAAEDLRFIDHDELRYSLRSLEQYAPWIRHIYLVTDRQRPSWLVPDHPRLTVVDHRDIAPAGSALPTFNSHAIEANLHRIEGLSEHFLYFNDDVFLSSPVGPELFFSPNGIAHMYLSKAQVAPGAPRDGEPASDTAGKNARALVGAVCGRRVSRKLFHAPFALQRSVSAEIEERWPEVVASTRAAAFRRTSDVTVSGALHMNLAYATARAVTRGLRYRYVNVGAGDAETRLAGLERDRDSLQTFCLNEADPQLDPATVNRLVRDFLRRRFPDRSTFELPEVHEVAEGTA